MAAWKLLHSVLGYAWAGAGDPFVAAASKGLFNSAAPRGPRRGIRMDLSLRILKLALARRWKLEALAFAAAAERRERCAVGPVHGPVSKEQCQVTTCTCTHE